MNDMQPEIAHSEHSSLLFHCNPDSCILFHTYTTQVISDKLKLLSDPQLKCWGFNDIAGKEKKIGLWALYLMSRKYFNYVSRMSLTSGNIITKYLFSHVWFIKQCLTRLDLRHKLFWILRPLRHEIIWRPSLTTLTNVLYEAWSSPACFYHRTWCNH